MGVAAKAEGASWTSRVRDLFEPARLLGRTPSARFDLFNEMKDQSLDALFGALRPRGPAAMLRGAKRVAYGPLDAPPTLKRPLVMIPGLTMPAKSFDPLAKHLAGKPGNGPESDARR